MASILSQERQIPLSWPQDPLQCSLCFPHQGCLGLLSFSPPTFQNQGAFRVSPEHSTLPPTLRHAPCTLPFPLYLHPFILFLSIILQREDRTSPRHGSLPGSPTLGPLLCDYTFLAPSMSPSCPCRNYTSLFNFVIRFLILSFSIKCQFHENSSSICLTFVYVASTTEPGTKFLRIRE